MAFDTQAYLNAAYPPPQKPPSNLDQPRLFLLSWNNKVIPRRPEHSDPQECYGVRFTNGKVALENGKGYETMMEMQEEIAKTANYNIAWLDEAGEDTK